MGVARIFHLGDWSDIFILCIKGFLNQISYTTFLYLFSTLKVSKKLVKKRNLELLWNSELTGSGEFNYHLKEIRKLK